MSFDELLPQYEKCSWCGREPKFACGSCYTYKYCDALCQRRHWLASHKQLCKAITEGRKLYSKTSIEFQCECLRPILNSIPWKFRSLRLKLCSNIKCQRPIFDGENTRCAQHQVYYPIFPWLCSKMTLLDFRVHVLPQATYCSVECSVTDNPWRSELRKHMHVFDTLKRIEELH